MPVQSGQLALQAQITALGERMEQGFNKLEGIMTGVEGRVRGLETKEAACQPIVTQRMDAAWEVIRQHSTDIKALNEAIISLKQTNKILTWVATILSSTVIIWLANLVLEAVK